MYSKLIVILFSISLSFSLNSFSQESWTPTSIVNAPSPRGMHTAIWTGNLMIVWGGAYLNSGGKYDPLTNTWTSTSVINTPTGREYHTAIWTGSKMVVWGGVNIGSGYLNTGGIYDPATDTWTATSTVNAPHIRQLQTAIWTGNKMIIWGGVGDTGIGPTLYHNTGGIYDPVANIWQPTSIINAPSPRAFHTAVWTGSKMIVWGGSSDDTNQTYFYNTGGIYDPVTNSWLPTSIINAPSPRGYHSAVWTGSKMIIWGGGDNSNNLNTGGVYDPVSDTWQPTSAVNAPAPRQAQRVIWTGTKMIIWGSWNYYPNYFNTGGIFDPITNTWLSTTTTNAPSPRAFNSSIWTGNKMVVWGGGNGNGLNTGGIYSNPAVIGISNISHNVPSKYSLYQNYPNPFNPTTKIKFDLVKSSDVKLIVFDILGREITILVNERLNPGSYETNFDASNYPSGIFYYKLVTESYSETKKMILIK